MDSRRRGLGGVRDEGEGGCGEGEEAEELHGRSTGQLNSKDTRTEGAGGWCQREKQLDTQGACPS